METKEKLIELMKHDPCPSPYPLVCPIECKYSSESGESCFAERYADYLIANNLVLQRHGKWLGEGDGYADGELVYDVWYCSECNNCIDDGTDDPADLPKFCSECGAKMDGDTGTFTGLAAVAAADINDGCKWIPVTERLPEPIDDVLVVIHNYMGVTVDMDWRTYDGRWAHNDEFVTHWMPLPEPPKEADNG